MITIQESNGMKYIKEGYSNTKYPDAKKIRNRRARELRKDGYKVEVKTWDFTDLSRSMYYTLEGSKFNQIEPKDQYEARIKSENESAKAEWECFGKLGRG